MIESTGYNDKLKMQPPITQPRLDELLAPLLASLPAAGVSPQPPTALLPLLSPILRQRVQLLSASSQEPWLPLLCYVPANVSKLEQAVKNERLEPHPVSGEVEVDWEAEVETKYRRIDEETLQALALLQELGLSVRLVWCVGDELGGGDGWRIGEVGVLDHAESAWRSKSIAEAEAAFKTTAQPPTQLLSTHNSTNGNSLLTPDADEDEDDDYWAQYDNTPARTPAPKPSPGPPISNDTKNSKSNEDSYYAQYASVQPAMDSHDPDEAQQNGDIETSLGKDEVAHELQQHLSNPPPNELNSSAFAWVQDHNESPPYMSGVEELAHPRPGSSSGSSGSDTVARLEREAASRNQNELGIKQHISTSVKSLYRLAKVAGISRAEFSSLVRTELDCLALMDEDD